MNEKGFGAVNGLGAGSVSFMPNAISTSATSDTDDAMMYATRGE